MSVQGGTSYKVTIVSFRAGVILEIPTAPMRLSIAGGLQPRPALLAGEQCYSILSMLLLQFLLRLEKYSTHKCDMRFGPYSRAQVLHDLCKRCDASHLIGS